MSRKKVPLKDKQIIKKRLAQGQSQREAIKGTAVESHVTAGKIARQEMTEIDQLRKEYVALIEKFEAGDIDRARLWAEMTRATKRAGLQGDVPDWQPRREALKYIDSLKGINKRNKSIQESHDNIFSRLAKEDRKYIVFNQAAKNAEEFVEREEV